MEKTYQFLTITISIDIYARKYIISNQLLIIY